MFELVVRQVSFRRDRLIVGRALLWGMVLVLVALGRPGWGMRNSERNFDRGSAASWEEA